MQNCPTMKPEERKAKIALINARLFEIHTELGKCKAEMEAIAENFRIERNAILLEAKVQTGRPQAANLRLHISARAERTFAAPSASWRTVNERGRNVARAQKTLATRDRYSFIPQDAKNARFTAAIPKRRNDGWQVRDLLAHAHPNEHSVVEQTEGELRPIRVRVAELVAEGTTLTQSRFQHERRLQLPEPSLMTKRVRGKNTGGKKGNGKSAGWAILEGQMSLELGKSADGAKTTDANKAPEPAQFRNPRR